jgi:hypothetical protein
MEPGALGHRVGGRRGRARPFVLYWCAPIYRASLSCLSIVPLYRAWPVTGTLSSRRWRPASWAGGRRFLWGGGGGPNVWGSSHHPHAGLARRDHNRMRPPQMIVYERTQPPPARNSSVLPGNHLDWSRPEQCGGLRQCGALGHRARGGVRAIFHRNPLNPRVPGRSAQNPIGGARLG